MKFLISIFGGGLIVLVLMGPRWLWSQTAYVHNMTLDILRRMPLELQKELGGAQQSASGMVGINRVLYRGAQYQRDGMDTMIEGIALRDQNEIDEGFQVANATFMRQTDSGSFGEKTPTDTAVWLTACARSFLALKQCEYWPDYQIKVQGYDSSFRLGMNYLTEHFKQLEKEDQNSASRLLMDADALFLTSGLLGINAPPEAGQLRDAGLALFDKGSGAFLKKGASDSAYQEICLQMLMYEVTFDPSPDIDAVIRQGLDWELARVNADGSVEARGPSETNAKNKIHAGKLSEADECKVALMLGYAGELYQDNRYTQAALLIYYHGKP